MLVKIKRIDGATEFFESGSFVLSPLKDMRADILCAELFTTTGKRIARCRRPFQAFYKKFIYKPEPAPAPDPQAEEQTTEEAPAEAPIA